MTTRQAEQNHPERYSLPIQHTEHALGSVSSLMRDGYVFSARVRMRLAGFDHVERGRAVETAITGVSERIEGQQEPAENQTLLSKLQRMETMIADSEDQNERHLMRKAKELVVVALAGIGGYAIELIELPATSKGWSWGGGLTQLFHLETLVAFGFVPARFAFSDWRRAGDMKRDAAAEAKVQLDADLQELERYRSGEMEKETK